MTESTALITNDAVVFGLLVVILAAIFHTSGSDRPGWRRFYAIVPTVLLAYFIPGILNSLGIIDGEASGIYPVARDYLLPTSLVLLTLSVDMRSILRLGPKALIMFLAGTLGVVVGGPIALAIVGRLDPSLLGDPGVEATWRGMAAQAGSWIGGGANQAAMKEVFDAGPDIFGKFVAVDIVLANLWLAVLLFLAGRAPAMDARSGADTRAIDELKARIETFQRETARQTGFDDLMVILGLGFGVTAVAHWMAGGIVPWITATIPGAERYSLTSTFFWVVVVATTLGLLLSFTRARNYEGAGASKVGSACLYILVAAIGMQMDIRTVLSDPELFLIGAIWILVHAVVLFGVARLIRAPIFYLAVGSQANIGGAASAPVVASAFHPALAPVGVLLAVLGYALGTYAAYLAGLLLRLVASG
ncbi:MAG: DUF819 domain-containing protein [Gemmatimonadales bacterium]|nr:DUF819 family protein [Gemmatimonadales bacterium]